jgi:hypothetical protein
MRAVPVVLATLLAACVPNLNDICPYGKKQITQGVFGEILSDNALEQNVEVDVYSVLNGVKDNQFGSADTSRGGYQFDVNAGMCIVCAKGACSAPIAVPTGVVEVSGTDTGSTVTWDAPVAVPPSQTIGPCTWD